MIESTFESLSLTRKISDEIDNKTFHHHYHILYDIANTYPSDHHLKYLEIGCYAGGSACLMLQRKNTAVTSIDLGHPIPKETVIANVKKLNVHENSYVYIQGDSQTENTHSQVTGTYDMIFIDGDHRYNGVMKDFQIYSKFLAGGGYIIFDDYNDYIHSPDVKRAVDFLVNDRLSEEYEIIGTFKNVHGARGFDASFTDGNCFVIKKKT
jgi:predicted O-methyltransferase YrrM